MLLLTAAQAGSLTRKIGGWGARPDPTWTPHALPSRHHPQLGITNSPDFNFITSVGSEHLHFPKLPYLKFQNNYVRVSSALLALYQCLKSLFNVTEL